MYDWSLDCAQGAAVIDIYLTNNTSLPIEVSSSLSVPARNTKVMASVPLFSSGESRKWISIKTGFAKSPDLQVYLYQSGGNLRDYAVQIYDGSKSLKSETLPGTEVHLEENSLHIVIDYAFEPWMKLLPATKRLDQLTLPGTHDSATWAMNAPSRCHSLTLEEQLYLGIRYFDIRVSTGSTKLQVVHASGATSYTLFRVATIFRDFLSGASGPDGTEETVVMQLKVDDGDDNDETGKRLIRRLKSSFSGTKIKHLHLEPLGLNGNVKTLGDLRGKLVLMRRFEHAEDDQSGTPVKYFVTKDVYQNWRARPSGTTWPQAFDASPDRFEWCDPGAGEIDYRNRHGLSFRIQDNYTAVKETKWTIVKNLLNDTVAGKLPDAWYLNFTSAAGNGPETVANYVNPGVATWLLEAAKRSGLPRYGTILMDFPTLMMIRMLIQKNFMK